MPEPNVEPHVLVVNAGSTSVKLAVFTSGTGDEPSWSANLPTAGSSRERAEAVEGHLRTAPVDLARVAAVGHRIVHGADRFDRPVVIDAEVEAAIEGIAKLAPLHNQAGLDGVAAARRVVRPGVPQIAVFDTAFHRTIPLRAAAYGGPYEWLRQGLRRYGFHGISHEHAAHRAAALLSRPVQELRLVTCHLGGGSSLTAVDRGRSVDTTMGLTPLDGLVMATRSGGVDPALVLHLIRAGARVEDVEDLLESGSGLLGLSGVSGDLREVVAVRDRDDERARLAVDVFVHRVATGVGAMIGALGGLDALVFTGGIGEHSSEVRARVGERFAFLGLSIDHEANRAGLVDADLSAPGAAVRLVVVEAREALAISRAARALIES
jgi:acetate kinase